MNCSIKNPAGRRYVIRMWVAAGLCVVFSVVAALTFRFSHPHGFFAYLFATLPALPIVGALFYTGVYLTEETDEFQRNLLVQSLLGGIGGILALETIWGNLEDLARAPHLDLVWIYPLFYLFVAISYGLVWLRYK